MSDNEKVGNTPVVPPQFRNLVYCSDVSGTGFWRHIQQILMTNAVQSMAHVYTTFTQNPICDPNYYAGMNSVTIQRWISDPQRNFVERFLRPLTLKTGTKLIYAIDDAMHYEDIPPFNRGRKAFMSEKIQDNIRSMLNASDFVVVTTKYIKDYYNRRYGVPLDRIVAVPNLLPRWWYGDRYDPDRKVAQFDHFKAKPRIGIISSLSHYNLENISDENGNIAKDDFDEIADLVRSTVDDFQWVVMGYAPPQIMDLVEKKKVHCYPPCAILQYPSAIEHLQLQAVVAPLQDIEFNRCKSHIKYMECCASGIPLFASNCLPYKGVMPEAQLFNTQDELKDKLMKLKFGSVGVYRKIIEQQWNWLNSEHDDGDFHIKNCWLDDNMDIWMPLFQMKPTPAPMPPPPPTISLED